MCIRDSFEDGGIVLGEHPGAGIEVDEAAITGHPDFENGWLQDAGPHVRPARAGLELVPSAMTPKSPDTDAVH